MDSEEGKDFSARNIIFSFIFVSILFAAGAYLYYNYQKSVIKKRIYSELLGISKLKIRDIDLWLKERGSDADMLFSNSRFTSDVERYISNPNSNNAKILFDWLNPVRSNHDYRNIFILNPDGNLIFSLRKPEIKINRSTVEEAKEVLQKNDYKLGDLKIDPATNSIYMNIYVPVSIISDGRAKPLGTVVLRINPYDSFYPAIELWPLPSRSAETFIVRKEGNDALFLSRLRFKKDAALKFKLPANKINLPAGVAVSGYKGIYEGLDYRNIPVLTDIRKIPGTGWFMITKIDRSEAFSSIYHEAWIAAILAAFFIAASAVVFYFFWRTQKDKFYRQHYSELLERQKIQSRLDIVIRNANDIFILLDESRNIIDVNETAVRNYGYSREEFLKLKADDLRAPAYKDSLPEFFNRLEKEKKILFETYHIRKNGEIFPVEIGVAVAEYNSGKVIQSIIRDITERKNFENRLVKFAQIYAVLSNINQLIVRTKDKSKILKEACEIAVRDGGLRMAWIGIIDGEGNLVVQSSSGFVADYLDNVNINLKDSVSSSGPCGRCALTGVHQIANDIENDASMATWRENALKNKYLSSASFPIFEDSGIIATFNLYSDQKNYFNTENLRLIDEMASDISFAMSFICNEQKREKAEQETEYTMQLFKALFEVSPVPTVLVRLNGFSFLEVSDAFTELFGYSKEELGKFNFIENPIWENSKEIKLRIDELARHKTIRNYEFNFRTKAGGKGVGLLYAEIIELHEDKFILSKSIDITDRKKAEEALSQSQKRYKELFESNPNPMWVYETESLKFVDVNKVATLHYGYSKEEFLSMTLRDIRPKEDIRNLEENIRSSTDEVQDSGIWRHKKKNGEIIFVEIKSNALYLKEYGGCRIVLANDVTERVKAREAVQNAEKRFRNTLDNMMEGCQIIGFDWRYLYLNDVAANQGHFPKEHLLGKTITEMYPGIENTSMFESLNQCMKERIPINMENEFAYPEGTKNWFNLRMEPVPEGVFILSEDITRNKLNEEELKKYREQLEQMVATRTEQLEAANKELESFSYSVSHDLRAPLRAIDGFSKMILESYKDKLDSTGVRWLDIVRKNSQQMGQLIDDLLQFSRTGRKEVSPVSIDMNELFASSYNELTVDLQDRKINFSIDELPKIKADYPLIKQVVINLLSNSIKFTRNKETAEIKVGGFNNGVDVVFYVQDNGAGFDMAYKDKLFGVFQRLHRTDEFEGTGVGLALVNRIVAKHYGKVWADSKIGEGAAFYFSLPA